MFQSEFPGLSLPRTQLNAKLTSAALQEGGERTDRGRAPAKGHTMRRAPAAGLMLSPERSRSRTHAAPSLRGAPRLTKRRPACLFPGLLSNTRRHNPALSALTFPHAAGSHTTVISAGVCWRLSSEQSIATCFVCRKFATCPPPAPCAEVTARRPAGSSLVRWFILVILFPPVEVSDLRWRAYI